MKRNSEEEIKMIYETDAYNHAMDMSKNDDELSVEYHAQKEKLIHYWF